MDRREALGLVILELERATGKHPEGFHSPHEGASIIREEFEEFWDEVKRDNLPLAREEVTQLAAMSLRFLVDL